MAVMANLPRRRWMVILLFAAALAASAQTVYVTRTGTKYHAAGCSSLKKSGTAIELSVALARGYAPCALCNPPTTAGGTAGARAARGAGAAPSGRKAALYRVATEGLVSTAQADVSRMLRAHVIQIVDGDTIKVSLAARPKGLAGKETIRLIGVDTPETVDPRKPVQAYGAEASAYARRRLLNRDVYLAFDWDLRDKYDRLLAYVYLGNGDCFNAQIIREGYGQAYLTYAFQFTEEFRALQKQAREARRGLWGRVGLSALHGLSRPHRAVDARRRLLYTASRFEKSHYDNHPRLWGRAEPATGP